MTAVTLASGVVIVGVVAGAMLACAAGWRTFVGPLIERRELRRPLEPGRTTIAVHENHERGPTAEVWIELSCGHGKHLEVPAQQARDRSVAVRCGCPARGYPISVRPIHPPEEETC